MKPTSPEIEAESHADKSSGQQANDDHFNYETNLSLAQFRALVGIPQDESSFVNRTSTGNKQSNATKDKSSSCFAADVGTHLPRIPPPTIQTSIAARPRFLIFLRLLPRPSWTRPSARARVDYSGASGDAVSEQPTSMYYSLIVEESDQLRLYHMYNFVTYTCLILQLVIASALIIIGAIPSPTPSSGSEDRYTAHRIAVAVLGAVTGLLTGILALLKGQGLPNRLLQYRSRLRQVRHRIEFIERALRADVPGTLVTYHDVIKIWQEYEDVLKEHDVNKPDAWAISTTVANSENIDGKRAADRSKDLELGVFRRDLTQLGILPKSHVASESQTRRTEGVSM